ncbi:MAG: prolipoprotein diacylglyceryl transferase [Firmicutes bacterium]|nr:prolipoprotein diacylglyceryl transferase [Bacillota bacterium]
MDNRSLSISFPIFGQNFVINPPSYISVFGFHLYLYGMVIALGFLLAVFYCLRRSRDFGFKSDTIIDMLLFAVPSAVIGARLYSVIFTWSDYSSFWQMLDIRSGGLSILGAVIGAVIAAAIFGRVKKIPIGALLDTGSFGLLIGQAVGRWGNFFNREVYGVATNLPWKMGFINPDTGQLYDPSTRLADYVHPLFFYECLWNVLGLVLLHIFSKKVTRKFDGQLVLMYVIWYGVGRALLESIRADVDVLKLGSIPISQLTAALAAAVGAVLLIVLLIKHKNGSVLWVDNPKNPVNARAAASASGPSSPEGNQDKG